MKNNDIEIYSLLNKEMADLLTILKDYNTFNEGEFQNIKNLINGNKYSESLKIIKVNIAKFDLIVKTLRILKSYLTDIKKYSKG